MSSRPNSDDRRGTTAFTRVFDAFEPFGRSFGPDIVRRLLIYETDPFGLGEEELLALVTAAEVEDTLCVYVSAEKPNPGQENSNLYVLTPLGVETYCCAQEPWTIVPHAIFPPSGAWGVMTTNESYAVAGGSEAFIARLLRALERDEDEMIAAWLDARAQAQTDAIDGGRHIAEWVPGQLAHIVGSERAARALRSSRLRLE